MPNITASRNTQQLYPLIAQPDNHQYKTNKNTQLTLTYGTPTAIFHTNPWVFVLAPCTDR